MAYLKEIDVKYADSPSIDAFGRGRVSQLTTQFDSKQLNDNQPLFIDRVTGGSGSHSWSGSTNETQLKTSAASDYAVAQTYQRFNYQSGKSQLIFMTFSDFNVETNIEKRIGYFSSSTSAPYTASYDGLFLENDGTDIRVRSYRNGTSTTNVAQSSWNLDTMDGNGDSGVTIDFEKAQILVIDFEWLGVGRVRFGFVVDGMVFYFHEILNANSVDNVYMLSPNQPLRWEIRQTGLGSGTFTHICSSVNSEGSLNSTGKVLSDNLGTTHVNANSTSSKYALLGIRLQSAKVDTIIDIIDFSVLATTNDNQLVEIWLNPTVAGTFTYSSVTNSSVQIAKGASGGSNTVTGGTLLFSKYISAQDATPIEIENAIKLGMSIAGTVDEIVLSTNPLSSNSDVLGSITWTEKE